LHTLPVFATAREVYAFLWRETGAILRLSWFPVLLMTVVGYFVLRARMNSYREIFSAGDVAAAAAASSAATSYSFWDLTNDLVQIAGAAIVAVALHRVILFNDRQPGVFINFNLGKVEGLFILLPVLLSAGIVLFASAIGALFEGVGPGALGLAVACLVAPVFFLVVRYSLVFPIAVVERRYNFRAAWALSRGNFWRLVGLWLVVAVPVLMVFFLMQGALMSGVLLDPGSAGDVSASIDRFEAALMRTLVLSFPASIIFGALGVGVLSYSYKVLTGRRPDEVV
jgi:hypothetical protein